MARIRSVKPDFFTHPHIVACSIPARILLEALWCQADDAGRLRDQPMIIRALSFGEDDVVDIRALLAELVEKGRILRYEVGGQRYIYCHGFGDHQRPQKPTPSRFPAPPSTTTVGLLEESRSAPVAVALGVGEGIGVGGGVGEPATQIAPLANPIARREAIAEQFDREIRAVYPPSRVGDHLEALEIYAALSPEERNLAGRNLSGWIRHASWQAEQVRFVKNLVRWLSDGSWKEPAPAPRMALPSAVPTPAELARLKARRLAGKYHLTPDQESWLARDCSILDDGAEDEDLAAAARAAIPFEPADPDDPDVASILGKLRRRGGSDVAALTQTGGREGA